MPSLRSPVIGVVLFALATLAACGGPPGSSGAATATQNAASVGGEPTDEPAVTPSAAASTGGGGGTDVQAVADALKPPNSSQTFTSNSSGVILSTYTSTDSADSLKSFYESAIPAQGLKIISTSSDTATNSIAIIFAKADDSAFGGAIGIGPDQSGGAGSTVSVTVGGSQ